MGVIVGFLLVAGFAALLFRSEPAEMSTEALIAEVVARVEQEAETDAA